MQSRTTSSDERDVLTANEALYRAFRERDLEAMRALWSQQHPVACIHPGWEALYGHDEVMASWQAILENPDAPEVSCVEANAAVLGETAYVTCVERLGPHVELVATNLFVRENGRWKLVHHQAGPFTRDSEREVDPTELN